MSKITTEDFIRRAKLAHGDKYDYSKTVYERSNKPVIIVCPIHGEFEQQPGHHMRGHGCPACAGVKQLTTEDFVKRAKSVHGDKYDYSKSIYKNKNTKITITCPIHGDFEQKAEDHYRGRGCQKCWFDEHTKRQTYTKEQFLLMARQKFGWKFDYSELNWVGYEAECTIICPKHGAFITTPHNHLACDTGCPKCGREKANNATSYTKEDFLEKAKAVHGEEYDYSKVEYIDYHTPVIIICKQHGEFLQSPHSHASAGQGCPKCRLKSQAKLQKKLQDKFPGKFLKWEYSPNWINWQRIDIADEGLSIGVEFNGIQHYEPVEHFGGEEKFLWQQAQDLKKQQLCENNNFHLFWIKYDYKKSDFEELCNKIQEIIDNTGQITEE